MKPIGELKDIYVGHDIYVVASGASAGFIDAGFFDNKIAVGVNQVWKRFPNMDYIVRKDANNMESARRAAKALGFKLIVSERNCGTLKYAKNKGADYYFEHLDNALQEIDLSVVGTDKIAVSYSTTTSAIHLAAYMGAANIILVGHDCGKLDGKSNFVGYPEPPSGHEFYDQFLSQIEPATIALREKLKETYHCNLYSLNPFVNFGLEGHVYKQ